MLSPIASVEKLVRWQDRHQHYSLLPLPSHERLSIVRAVPASSSQDEMKKQPVGSWSMAGFESISTTRPCSQQKLQRRNSQGDKLHYDVLKDPTARLTAQQDGTTLGGMVPADAGTSSSGRRLHRCRWACVRFAMFNLCGTGTTLSSPVAPLYALDTDKMLAKRIHWSAEIWYQLPSFFLC